MVYNKHSSQLGNSINTILHRPISPYFPNHVLLMYLSDHSPILSKMKLDKIRSIFANTVINSPKVEQLQVNYQSTS